jgi:hypothetical protein
MANIPRMNGGSGLRGGRAFEFLQAHFKILTF